MEFHDFSRFSMTGYTLDKETTVAAILFFLNAAKNILRQDFMVMNISCKSEKSSYNIF